MSFCHSRRRVDLVGGPAARLDAQRLLGIGLGRGQHCRAGIGAARSCDSFPSAVDRHAGDLAARDPTARRPPRRSRAAVVSCGRAPTCAGNAARGRAGSGRSASASEIVTMRWRRRSLAAGSTEPRNAWPSTPWSVLIVTRPSSLLAGEAAGVPAVLRGGDVVPGKKRDGDVGDLHGRLPALHSPASRTEACRPVNGASVPALWNRQASWYIVIEACRTQTTLVAGASWGGAVTMGAFRALVFALLVLGAGYASPPAQAQQKVVIYSSNDDTLHKLVFAAFTKETGIAVEPVSAGSGVIVKRIQTEKDRPGGDIIWGVSRSLLETNKQFFSPYASKNQRRHPRGVPRADRPLDRQQPASDGDPAEHQGAPGRPGPQDLGRPARSQVEGQDCLHRPGQLRIGLFDRDHARRPLRRRRSRLGQGQAAHRQHPRAEPLLAGVPGRRQRRISRWASRSSTPAMSGPPAERR